MTRDTIQSISVNNNNSVPVYDAKGGAAMAASGSPVPVSAGQLIVEVDASVTYTIK